MTTKVYLVNRHGDKYGPFESGLIDVYDTVTIRDDGKAQVMSLRQTSLYGLGFTIEPIVPEKITVTKAAFEKVYCAPDNPASPCGREMARRFWNRLVEASEKE